MYRTCILLVLLFFCCRAFTQESVWYRRCVGVSDDDTIRVLTAKQQLIKVRVAFIDCPEARQPFGTRAKQAMSRLFR